MTKQLFGTDGRELRQVELDDSVFDSVISKGAIYDAVKNELANLRQGTASTKTRGEVHGSNTKPWRQKGTGRARSGQKRSPLWRGGGIIFGPRPRDYSYKIPKKVKHAAVRSVLTLKSRNDTLKLVEDFSVESGRTKDLARILANLIPQERTVIVLKDDDQLIRRAGRNLPWVTFLSCNRLRVHDLFYARHLLVLESAAASVSRQYGQTGSEAEPLAEPAAGPAT